MVVKVHPVQLGACEPRIAGEGRVLLADVTEAMSVTNIPAEDPLGARITVPRVFVACDAFTPCLPVALSISAIYMTGAVNTPLGGRSYATKCYKLTFKNQGAAFGGAPRGAAAPGVFVFGGFAHRLAWFVKLCTI